MQQCTIIKGWTIPRYFKLYFQLINQGENKSYICEHDLFVFMQELEGVAPTALNTRPKQESKDVEDSILNMDLAKRFKQEGGSLFA